MQVTDERRKKCKKHPPLNCVPLQRETLKADTQRITVKNHKIIENSSKASVTTQVHIVVDKNFYQTFLAAIEKQGFRTAAEYFRQAMREALEKGE